jgi:hypothetical protein
MGMAPKGYLMLRITTIDFADHSAGRIIGPRRDHAMPVNAYALETIAADRIAEHRRAAARRALLRAAGVPRPLRVRVGGWLIHAGELLAGPSPAGAPATRPSHAH